MSGTYSLPDFKPRIHSLDWSELRGCKIWVLRDDEGPTTMPGGKLRKYRHLIPYLINQQIQRAYFVGGRNSNNLVGLAQCLVSAGIEPVPVLPSAHEGAKKGVNELLLGLLVEKKNWVVVGRDKWPEVELDISERVKNDDLRGLKSIIIPEGCFMPQGIEGSMELAKEIAEYQDNVISFDHIVMESGTGCSAIGLLLGGKGMGLPTVEILSLAEGKEQFRERMLMAAQWRGLKGQDLPVEGKDFRIHLREKGRFGKVSPSDMEVVREFSRRFGILIDSVYTPPLIQALTKWSQMGLISGNILLILSGGAQTLPGFLEK